MPKFQLILALTLWPRNAICVKLNQWRCIHATQGHKWSPNLIRTGRITGRQGCQTRNPDASNQSTTVNSLGVQDLFVRSLTLGVAAAALFAGGAHAADLIIPTTPVPIYAPAG